LPLSGMLSGEKRRIAPQTACYAAFEPIYTYATNNRMALPAKPRKSP
jgi:hypothetical protein